MKKILIIIACLVLLTGCNNKEIKSSNQTEYSVLYNSVDIKLGTFFNNIIATIGPYNTMRIEESNYQEGQAHIYEYDDFEIETYVEDNVEKIYSITFISDSIQTNEGITIGDSEEKLLSLYNDNYIKDDYNNYIYNLSNTNILFATEDGIIIDIIYYLT